MIPLNICFSQNMKAKIQGLGQDVRVAFESIENYIKAQDEKMEQLYKENAELKSRIEKSVELPCKVGSEVYVTVNGKRFMSAKLYGKNETGAYLVLVEISEHKHIYDWFRKIYTKEEAEQALKGGTDNE